MSGSIGLSESNTLWLIRFAGASEVIFGILLLVFYKQAILLYLNIVGFVALLLFVLVMTPHLMVEAFNPVTTNLPLIVLSLVLIHEAKKRGSEST
tara:strand:- start:3201 stop:3485 length:285 start_codon:yes stop_codon:yes gene_type:complete